MYAWYEILGYAVIVGVTCFAIFRGLDLALEWWLGKRVKAQISELNRDDESRGA